MRRRMRYRPSKASCVFGGIVGIIFSCIGVFMVIPTFGPFGILWTLIAIGITIYQFAMAAGKVSMGSWTVEDEDGAGQDSGPAGNSSVGDGPGRSAQDRLTELQNLYDRRLISQEEYEQKRQEILKEL